MTNARWIVIPNWDEFQHYKDREPPWIKTYTRLLSDDAYLSLTHAQRAVLHGIWLDYARSARQVPDNTSSLSRRLSVRVTRPTLDALNHAGFIHFSASKPLASRYQPASPEAERETEEEKETPVTPTAPEDPGHDFDQPGNGTGAHLTVETLLDKAAPEDIPAW